MKKTALIVSLIAASLALSGCKDDLKAPEVKNFSHPLGMDKSPSTEINMFLNRYCQGEALRINEEICQRMRLEYACHTGKGTPCDERSLNRYGFKK